MTERILTPPMRLVTEDPLFYYVHINDGTVHCQRKRPLRASDDPLSLHEETIILLCKAHSSETKAISQLKTMQSDLDRATGRSDDKNERITREGIELWFEMNGFPRYVHSDIRDLAIKGLEANAIIEENETWRREALQWKAKFDEANRAPPSATKPTAEFTAWLDAYKPGVVFDHGDMAACWYASQRATTAEIVDAALKEAVLKTRHLRRDEEAGQDRGIKGLCDQPITGASTDGGADNG